MLAAALALTACAAPTRYAGIDLRPAAAPLDLQRLALAARGGDKHALFTLGTLYEGGYGLPRDLKQARALYRQAARRTGGTIFVYQPPVRKGGSGQVVPVNTGPVSEGLPQAKARLALVEAKLAAEAPARR